MVHSRPHISHITFARVVKLADTPDLGSGAARREGSSPSPSILKTVSKDTVFFVFGIIDLYEGLDSTGGPDCSASGLLLYAPLLDMSSKTPRNKSLPEYFKTGSKMEPVFCPT